MLKFTGIRKEALLKEAHELIDQNLWMYSRMEGKRILLGNRLFASKEIKMEFFGGRISKIFSLGTLFVVFRETVNVRGNRIRFEDCKRILNE